MGIAIESETETEILNPMCSTQNSQGQVTYQGIQPKQLLSCYQPKGTYATREPGASFRCQTVRPKRGLLLEAVTVSADGLALSAASV